MVKSILKSTIILTSLSIMVACNSTNRLTIKNQKKMFTVEQIKTAHSKVKSGADFPSYIKEIKALGVTYYETYVSDGHTDYYGTSDYKTSSEAKYAVMAISETVNNEQFKLDLKAHQQGKTDYMTFCKESAEAGVESWTTDLNAMTVIYYDKQKNELVKENIPQLK